MSIEAISECQEGYRTSDCEHNQTITWDGKEITLFELRTLFANGDLLNQTFPGAEKSVKAYGIFIYGGGSQPSLGYCLQGHRAYHSYVQDNYPTILLCNEDGCVFELYAFKRYVGGEK